VSEEEEKQLIEECNKAIKRYGIQHLHPKFVAIFEKQMGYLAHKIQINMMRVTGRYESARQRLAAWGYGKKFDR